MKRIIHYLIIALAIGIHTENNQAGAQVETADSVYVKAVVPIDLVDINYEFERIQKNFRKIESSYLKDSRLLHIDSSFNNYKIFLQNEATEFRAYNPYNLSKFFLENSYRLWEGFNGKLSGWQTEVNNRLKVVQESISDLNSIRSKWKMTLESENYTDEPEELKNRIRNILKQADEYHKLSSDQKWKYIKLGDEIAEMLSFNNSIIADISQLQQNQRDSLFIAVVLPMWEIKVTTDDYLPLISKLDKARHENTKTLRNYFQSKNFNFFWMLMLCVVILFNILRYRYLKKNFNDSKPGYKTIVRIFVNHPILTQASIILVSFHLLFPYYPLILANFITLILLINMRFILSNFIDRESRNFITRIIILLIINNQEVVSWYFGDLSRYYILLETSLGILLTINYLKPVNWKLFQKKNINNKAILLLSALAFLSYSIGFISNFFGYLDLAVLANRVAIHVPEFTIVLYGLYLITVALITSKTSLGKESKTNLLAAYWDDIEKRSIQVAGILAVLYWFYSFTVSLEISRQFYSSLVDFFVTDRSIGTMEFTIGSIFAMVLIFLLTFLFTGILKVVIEHILLKKVHLPRGVPAAISVTIRYFLVIMGSMFALSVAGIELSNFGLLAGALGVGIGFGLQNIVNNFISGLILVYERPIQVGDTIEVETLIGQVNRIGLRSSNVRTYDGAEVVVPNGNLISNQLINWTLSDNRRRIEVKVGVSYGSDPNIVLELLEKVAAGHADVLQHPEPLALFDNFGNSSLNFRLLFWVPYEMGFRTKSAVAIGIFNIFRENGISIPFPQIDLHVKEKEEELNKEELKAIESQTKETPDHPGPGTA